MSEISLSIGDISTTVAAAICEYCRENEDLASGIIGPSYACSGPGSGWQTNCDTSDYAQRALSGEYGATGYVDPSDGRLATLDEDGDIVWTGESIVSLVAPTKEQIYADLSTAEKMVAAIDSGQCLERSVWSGDWDEARAFVNISEKDALELLGADLVEDSVVFFDDGTDLWYRNDRSDLDYLRILMNDSDPDVVRDAYSHWCSGTTSLGEYQTQEEAFEAAGTPEG